MIVWQVTIQTVARLTLGCSSPKKSGYESHRASLRISKQRLGWAEVKSKHVDQIDDKTRVLASPARCWWPQLDVVVIGGHVALSAQSFNRNRDENA